MKPEEIRQHIDSPIFRTIAKAASDYGVSAYIVGGYVRDLLLDRESKDIDIVVDGSGIDFAHFLSERLQGTRVNYFKNFGTAMFHHNGVEYELVGARKESYKRDSRKPIVEDGTLEEDRERRDFTMNAISVSLNESSFGDIIDPLGGIKHLNEKLIVTPLDPAITYSDDPLRMMRAIRFAAQLGFRIEENSFEAIKSQKYRIKIVSQERITEELNKIILSPKPSIGFKLLDNTDILELIFPRLTALKGVEIKNGLGHKDNFFHTLKVLDNAAERSDDLWLRWAAILHDIAKPDTKQFDNTNGWTFHGHEDLGAKLTPGIFRSLKLPLDHKMKFVQKLVRLHLRPISLSKKEVSASGIRRLLYDAGEDLDSLMILCESDITSKNEVKVKKFLENFQRVRVKCKEVEESDKIKNWQPPIGGEEIMNTFGLKPGREVGIIKTAIREAILEGEIKNEYEAAKELMLIKAQELGLQQSNTP